MVPPIKKFGPTDGRSISGSAAIAPRKRAVVINRILDAAFILVLTASVLYILDDTDRTPAQSDENALVALSTPQELPSDPQDPLVVADTAAVRAFRDALARQLADTNSRLLSFPNRQEDRRRRYTIEKMLTNAAKTGVSDRLTEIEKAINLDVSRDTDSAQEQALVKKAIRDIHDTAESCRSGALAKAAKELGVPISYRAPHYRTPGLELRHYPVS